jgi:competence protein ComEC
VGDSILREKSPLRELYLDDSRTYFRMSPEEDLFKENVILFAGRRVWLVENSHAHEGSPPSQEVDLLVLSGNPRLYFSGFAKNLRIKQVVIDASVPAWKSRYWKKDCDSLGIPWHDVTTHGAFVMRIR